MTPSSIKKISLFFGICSSGFDVDEVWEFNSLQKNTIYFFSPTDLSLSSENPKGLIRVGGLVKKGSVQEKKNEAVYAFIVTDLKNDVYVEYKGILPNLFQEGKGVVVEGTLKDKKFLLGKTILAKHDENYMPPEVKEGFEEKWKLE